MAIDLPPAIPPQLATVEFVTQRSSQGDRFTGQVGETVVEIYGNTRLDNDTISAALAEAGNPSQAVLRLNEAYWNAGHLLVSLQYAVNDDKLVIAVTEGALADIIAPESVYPFFDQLIGDTDLTRDEFEDARLMANIKSERAGYDLTVRYHMEPNAPEQVTLVMESVAQDEHDATAVNVTVGNPGNRFVGRYFGNVGVSHQFDTGATLNVGWETAITSLNSDEDLNGGLSYDRYLISIDQPTQFGLYSLSYNQSRFRTEDSLGARSRTQIVDIAASGEQMLIRSNRTRLSIREAIGHIEDETTGATTSDEPHTYASVGVNWLQRYGNLSRFVVGLKAKQGLEANSGTTGTDSQFTLLSPTLGTKASLFGNFWLDVDMLGQFVQEKQSVPSQQQWSLGGMSSLSAWFPGVLTSDEGYFGRAALTWRGNPAGQFRPSLSVFFEHGTAEDADGATSVDLSDAGIRGTVQYANNTSLDVIVARPIDDERLNAADDITPLEADFFFLLRHKF